MNYPPEDFVTHLRKCSASEGSFFDRCADHIERLRAVAIAAKALVESVHPSLGLTHEMVGESELTALESALDAAGYGLTEDEIERDEPPEDGECFRGDEAAAYHAEQQQKARRLK